MANNITTRATSRQLSFELFEEMLARHSNQAIEKVRKDIDRDKIMTAEETKEYGLVDTVLVSRKKSLQTVGASS